MSFDIAIGRCLEFDESAAIAKLDGAMLRKLCPTLVFAVQINARLRVPLSICSGRRPPRQGQELFLDYIKTRDGAEAWLDIQGSGHYSAVDIRPLANGLDSVSSPEPERKPARSGWSGPSR
ncbi:MAG: hypothetical protein JNN30_04255 [Rhodanobacteraceae bacterium]|nr:hypothetical protein [Rhodanobacteraceae bacterium]